MYDVVVVGGGVAGLSGAIAAARAGADGVLVVERQHRPSPVHKGEFLQPRTLAVLDEWGVLDELGTRGALRLDGLQCRDSRGRPLGMFDYRSLPDRFNFGLTHYYAQIRDALLSRLPPSVEVESGRRVSQVIRHDRQVTGIVIGDGHSERRVPARLVLAADGPQSLVRKQLGLTSRRTNYRHGFLGFDVAVSGLPDAIVNFLTRDGARILYPLPGGRARLYIQVPEGGLAEARGRTPERWRLDLLASCPGLEDLLHPWPRLERPQSFPAYRAMAEHWTQPGAALVGEAAHTVHPMAGQGMNTAVVDGWALGAALDAAGPGPFHERVDAALHTYADSRSAQVHLTAQMSDRLAQLCTVTSPIGLRLIRAVLRRNRHNVTLMTEATRRLAGLTDEPLRRRQWLGMLVGA